MKYDDIVIDWTCLPSDPPDDPAIRDKYVIEGGKLFHELKAQDKEMPLEIGQFIIKCLSAGQKERAAPKPRTRKERNTPKVTPMTDDELFSL